MEREEIIRIAGVIWDQLQATVPWVTRSSWGLESVRCGLFNEMATLKLKVNGFHHKGWVYISYDEGLDLYNIYLVTDSREVVKEVEGVYCDEFGDLLDQYIERGNMSMEEYTERVRKEYE